ncbi:ABC transporter permease [Borrelia turicatae]|uniref:ABC transporter permease n=3 Tax=Borrelia turicatae TaxID=142 RepID=A0A172XBK1_BORTU|nr:ABC transporter permease protein [Borrelia turicatae 91E135]ANF34036.1 ABC transporter permease [Borrelia turicatae]
MFSLKRFFLLFNFDFVYHRKLYLYFVFSIFLVFPLIYFFLKIYGFTNLINFVFINSKLFFFVLFCIVYIVSIYNMFDHYKPIHDLLKDVFYLSLPVSTLERYLFVLVKFLFILPLFLIICCYISLNLTVLLDKNFFVGNQINYLSLYFVFSFFKETCVIYFVGFPIFLLSRIIFKNYPFFRAIVIGSLFFTLLVVFFYFVIFFVNTYLFKVGNDFGGWGEYYFIKFICMLFAGFIYFCAYFILKNLGNLNTKVNLSILAGVISFFAVLFFFLLAFLTIFVYVFRF